ncbi:MAG: transcriptional regulator [Desulfovibrio sp.]|nr:MAG: transcriptional regulator [Desulfovibrio sp.]
MKLLLVVALLFILYKMFAGDKKHKQVKKEKEEENLAASGDMVKDPMCGAFVAKDGDIRVRQGDQVHCFCSYDCRDKYVKRLQSGQAPQAAQESEDTSS